MGAGASSAGLAAAVQAASEHDLRNALEALGDGPTQRLRVALTADKATGLPSHGTFKNEVPWDGCIRIPEHQHTGGRVELSAFDIVSGGRAIPMVWFYEETLDPADLLSALQQTLVAYPVFGGRYASPPEFVELSNAGVPVQVRTSDQPFTKAIAHFPATTSQEAQPTFFARNTLEAYVPDKDAMDPDRFSPETPLLSVRITLFRTGGTAIGLLMLHRVGDADTQISFARNWARTHRKLSLEPVPDHDRRAVKRLAAAGAASAGVLNKPEGFGVRAVLPGQQHTPEFAGMLPNISGNQVCIVPFTKHHVDKLKEAASAELPDGEHISADDVVTAHVWQALVTMRCYQLGLASDSREITTCSRACNLRQRTEPPLGASFCGNGVTNVRTEIEVRELLTLSVSEIAQRLRASLRDLTAPGSIPGRIAWLLQVQNEGCRTVPIFDNNALTFIISSWGDHLLAGYQRSPASY